ncbi:hypothetical protein VTK56DRAFT_8142 [Thermocarpiscus australiensis]
MNADALISNCPIFDSHAISSRRCTEKIKPGATNQTTLVGSLVRPSQIARKVSDLIALGSHAWALQDEVVLCSRRLGRPANHDMPWKHQLTCTGRSAWREARGRTVATRIRVILCVKFEYIIKTLNSIMPVNVVCLSAPTHLCSPTKVNIQCFDTLCKCSQTGADEHHDSSPAPASHNSDGLPEAAMSHF